MQPLNLHVTSSDHIIPFTNPASPCFSKSHLQNFTFWSKLWVLLEHCCIDFSAKCLNHNCFHSHITFHSTPAFTDVFNSGMFFRFFLQSNQLRLWIVANSHLHICRNSTAFSDFQDHFTTNLCCSKRQPFSLLLTCVHRGIQGASNTRLHFHSLPSPPFFTFPSLE
jgi:hypothetical protein